MRDAELNLLIRLAAEADALHEPNSRRQRLTSAPDAASATALRGVLPRIGLVGLAAAAALAWMFAPIREGHAPGVIPASAITIRHIPGQRGALPSTPRIDRFRSSTTEPCVVVAIFRAWSKECECLAWKLHEWDPGRVVDQFAAGETTDIALNVSESPPVTQLLFLAVAARRDQLASTGEGAHLLSCLNDASFPPRNEEYATLASAVQSCLPDGVTVVSAPFVVKP